MHAVHLFKRNYTHSILVSYLFLYLFSYPLFLFLVRFYRTGDSLEVEIYLCKIITSKAMKSLLVPK